MTTTRGPWSPRQAFAYDLLVGALVLVLRAAAAVVITAHAPAPIPAVTFAQAITGLVLLNLVAPWPMRRPSERHTVVEVAKVEPVEPVGCYMCDPCIGRGGR